MIQQQVTKALRPRGPETQAQKRARIEAAQAAFVARRRAASVRRVPSGRGEA